jgi:hypothetical protein
LLATIFCTWLGISFFNKWRESHLARCIHGALVLTPKNNPLEPVSCPCNGTQTSHLFSLRDGTQLLLSSKENAEKETSYELIIEKDERKTHHTLLANKPVELDEYTLCFETASC